MATDNDNNLQYAYERLTTSPLLALTTKPSLLIDDDDDEVDDEVDDAEEDDEDEPEPEEAQPCQS